MKEVQDVFDRTNKSKEEIKELNSQYKDALASSREYEEIKEKMKVMRDEKKTMEQMIQSEMGKDWDRLENLKEDLRVDREMLADIALVNLTNGKPIGVKDEKGNDYEPLFSVRYRKI